MRIPPSSLCLLCLASLAAGLLSTGCGTTKWSHTSRTATEQLLISDAMDRAVSEIDFSAAAGKKVFLDEAPLAGVTDSAYLTSLLRQHMLASGCLLQEARAEADYIVEVRCGAVGTDHRELTLGVPKAEVTGFLPMPGMPSSLPEMPFATKTEQRAVVKLSLFMYNAKTRRLVWQSGASPIESNVKDIWVLGAGPFRSGTPFDGAQFAGQRIKIPKVLTGSRDTRKNRQLSVNDEAYFGEPEKEEAYLERQRKLLAEKAAKEKAAQQESPPAEQIAEAAKDVTPAATPDSPAASEAASPAPPDSAVVPAAHTEPAEAKPTAVEDTKSKPVAVRIAPPKAAEAELATPPATALASDEGSTEPEALPAETAKSAAPLSSIPDATPLLPQISF